MDDHNNILIIGAGPSGLTLATELTRRGINCTIVDKAAGPAPLHESRALAFNARSQDILAASGVTRQICSAGHTIDQIRLCWNGSISKEIPMLPIALSTQSENTDAPSRPDNNQLLIIRQGEIERILIRHLDSLGVQVQWNTELADFTQSDSAVTATFNTADGATNNTTASYIIGCDGAHSQVRTKGGYTFDGESDPQTWTLADATLKDTSLAHTLIADLRPGQAFASIAIEDNIVRLIHNGPNILQLHPMADRCTKIHWQSEFRVSYRLVKRYHRGRSFLCGDAAHIHSPVGGRGMNLGIEDAATLAWLLETEQESSYTGLRLPVAKKVLKMTHQQTTQMNSSSMISSVAKKYGPKLLSIPYVNRSMKNSVLGLDTPTPEWLTK